MKETVSITGGSGGIGQALLERLVGLYQVRALFRTRNEVSQNWEHRGCTVVWGDLSDEGALLDLVDGAKFVFHCAALVMPAPFSKAYEVNVRGTRRLARAAAVSGCQRFIHISSIAVYSATSPETDYTEDIPLREHADMAVYSLTKLKSEHALEEVAEEHGLQYTILRPTCVYGPGTKSYTLAPVELIVKGIPLVLGDGHGLLDAVYVDDVANALILAANSPNAAGEVFNIGHEGVTIEDFYSYYGKMLARPVRHLPIAFVKAALRLLGLVPDRTRPSLQQLKKGARFLINGSENTKAFPSSKAARLFGYAPEISLSRGMMETELWLKSKGLAPRIQHHLESYGPLPFGPLAVVHPSSEEELVRIVEIARDRHLRVKAIGWLHSQCPVPYTDGVCVVLDKYDKLLRVEDLLVTVQAGMKLRDLNHALAERNLALPINGSITGQTVAGAISTGTHGGSIHHGALSDYVESVRIIKADGSIADVDRSNESFSGVILSMGLLGIVSTVTFRCVASFFLQSLSSVRDAEEVFEHFDRINQDNLYIDMLYFAVTDQMEILAINRIEKQRAELAGDDRRRVIAKPPTEPRGSKLIGRLKISGLRMLASVFRRSNSIQRYFTRISVGSSYRLRMGPSDMVLAFGDPGPGSRSPGIVGDMEIAIPYEQAGPALELLRSHFRSTQTYPLLPVHIRCSARSALWLSPAYERNVCWLEFCSYPRTDSLFKQVHELLKPFRYRFHWGKETVADRDYIKEQYERWEDFARLRSDWDPEGMFLNQYLQAFFPRP